MRYGRVLCAVCNSVNTCRVGFGKLWAGLAQPQSHLSEQALALSHAQLHPVVASQMLGQCSLPSHRFPTNPS